ncbi:MAG: hypothetical protein LBT44_08570 [Clostridiales bacterium]|nr:hypothetical protein [Clostridiales bacterium]
MPNVLKAGSVKFSRDKSVYVAIEPVAGPSPVATEESSVIEPAAESSSGPSSESSSGPSSESSSGPSSGSSSAAIAEAGKLRAEAEQLVQTAQSEARNILDGAKTQAAQTRESAEAEGRRLGYEEGLAQGQTERESVLEEARMTLENARLEKEKLLAESEGELVDLMTRILEKFLGNAARINPQLISHLIRAGLSGVSLTGDITIRISPDDYELVSRELPDILPGAEARAVPDASLSSMDCLIETPFGTIDCGLDPQFQRLKEDLFQILHAG